MIRLTALFMMTVLPATTLRADSTLTLASADMYDYHTQYSASAPAEHEQVPVTAPSPAIALVERQQPLSEEMFRFFYRGQETIPVTLSRAADIVLQLFDKDGQFVSVIYNGRATAGRNEIPIVWVKLWRGKYSVRVKENRY